MYELFRSSCVSCRMHGNATFVFVRNSLLSLMICFSLACASRSEARALCPTIEVSAVADSSRTPLVTTGDITSASASQDVDKWAVNFTVTDAAATRVHEFSKQHVGSNVALVVDGKVYGTPRIAGAIVGNKYRIDGFSRADAKRLASAITNGCRR